MGDKVVYILSTLKFDCYNQYAAIHGHKAAALNGNTSTVEHVDNTYRYIHVHACTYRYIRGKVQYTAVSLLGQSKPPKNFGYRVDGMN